MLSGHQEAGKECSRAVQVRGCSLVEWWEVKDGRWCGGAERRLKMVGGVEESGDEVVMQGGTEVVKKKNKKNLSSFSETYT